jgi:hypothetical protein
MSLIEIVDFLENWIPSTDFSGPSKEGMGAVLINVISEKPDRFAINAMIFKDFDIIYVRAFF